MNAGLLNLSTCGNPPIFGQTVTATYAATIPPKIVVTWLPGLDENSGEKDVDRYVVYRRAATATVFGEPYTSIPAGNATYSFSDAQIASGDKWVYGVAAEDCGGQFSSVTTSATVTVP
jgi:hypothetical protein